MELETMKCVADDLEDGELNDSDDGYTPLPRPMQHSEVPITSGPSHMDSGDIDDSPDGFASSSDSSSSDSDDCLEANSKREAKKKKRTIMIRVKQPDELQENRARFKKYDIWTASLQEESLTENMRGIDVTKGVVNDRNVENYDFSMKYRLNGQNGLKRRMSISANSGDEYSDGGYNRPNKRSKSSGSGRPIKERLGRKASSSSSESLSAPRMIPDLDSASDDPIDIAKDIAAKLDEEKDDLLVRIVTVLGVDLPVEIFKETQRIEADGGMLIMAGNRRRTPGGVFFFLLKHNDSLSAENRKLIFFEERKTASKDRKVMQAIKRDQKVEELKKRLSEKDKEMQLITAKMLDVESSSSSSNHLKPESNTLSNPPPSPVGHDHSPEYKSHAINHVNDSSPGKPTAKSPDDLDDESLTAYDDDFLDVHCDDMDLF